MSHVQKESDNDNDIHVISRDTNEYAHAEPMDTPSFMQSLDIPTPPGTNGALFDAFNPDLDSQLHGDQLNVADAGPAPNFHDPSILPLADFGAHENQLSKDFHKGFTHDDSNTYTGTLAKVDHSLPPLPPLSEPVLPSSLQIQNPASVPDFLHGNGSVAARQPLTVATTKRKKEPQAPKSRPAFVMKIWSMVNDPKNHQYIRWNDDGETFQVVHREEFMKNILPQYFKHNNFASFVRQLNMYGWHKIQDINSGSMKEDRSQEEVLQFKNPYFIRGREDLLDNIVRNKTGSSEETPEGNSVNVQYVINELESIKMNQLAIMEDMRRMRKDNQILWTESFGARDRHSKQAQTLSKIMKFLAAVYGNSAGKIFEVEDNNFDNHQMSAYTNASTNPNFAAPSPQPAPVSKPRLMLMDQAYRKASTGSTSPSMASTNRESIEEITRNTPHMQGSPENVATANKIYQQIMNPDSAGISSPSQFFPELSNSYFAQNRPTEAQNNANSASAQQQQQQQQQAQQQAQQRQHQQQQQAQQQQQQQQHEDSLSGLEENIVKQGQALSQVQDWIQALASRQQQQQEQLQQQQNSRSQENSPAGAALDDFDVDEFLDNNDLNAFQNPTQQNPNQTGRNFGKRIIEEVQDDDSSTKRRRV